MNYANFNYIPYDGISENNIVISDNVTLNVYLSNEQISLNIETNVSNINLLNDISNDLNLEYNAIKLISNLSINFDINLIIETVPFTVASDLDVSNLYLIIQSNFLQLNSNFAANIEFQLNGGILYNYSSIDFDNINIFLATDALSIYSLLDYTELNLEIFQNPHNLTLDLINQIGYDVYSDVLNINSYVIFGYVELEISSFENNVELYLNYDNVLYNIYPDITELNLQLSYDNLNHVIEISPFANNSELVYDGIIEDKVFSVSPFLLINNLFSNNLNIEINGGNLIENNEIEFSTVDIIITDSIFDLYNKLFSNLFIDIYSQILNEYNNIFCLPCIENINNILNLNDIILFDNPEINVSADELVLYYSLNNNIAIIIDNELFKLLVKTENDINIELINGFEFDLKSEIQFRVITDVIIIDTLLNCNLNFDFLNVFYLKLIYRRVFYFDTIYFRKQYLLDILTTPPENYYRLEKNEDEIDIYLHIWEDEVI